MTVVRRLPGGRDDVDPDTSHRDLLRCPVARRRPRTDSLKAGFNFDDVQLAAICRAHVGCDSQAAGWCPVDGWMDGWCNVQSAGDSAAYTEEQASFVRP